MNQKTKQFCEYIECYFVEVGKRASLYAINHPTEGTDIVHTSTVLEYDVDTGRIETKNTIYTKSK